MSGELTDLNEILFRQVHPIFYNNGQLSSQLFIPSKKDKNKLSVDRESLISAQKSHQLFTRQGYKSIAVYGLTVGDFKTEEITCFSDPISEDKDRLANPAHCLADYSPHTSNKQKIIGKRLRQAAMARGCLYSEE